MTDLISVDDAINRILNSISSKGEELSVLMDSYGRYLSRDVRALTDLPPFTNSSMDGFAVIASEIKTASPSLPVELIADFDIPAGSHPTQTIYPGHAARIMTGAPLPPERMRSSLWRILIASAMKKINHSHFR